MSRVYFHTPTNEAELLGSERAWLAHVARGPGTDAWDLGQDSSMEMENAGRIMAMVPEVPDGECGSNYLHTGYQEALVERAANTAAFKDSKPPFWGVRTSYEKQRMFLQSLRTRLRTDLNLRVGSHVMNSNDLSLNTALKMGSDPVKLAAKIHGWCEGHCYVEGEDRGWLAGIIDQGLDIGIYRKGMWYVDRPHDELTQGPRSEQPDAKFHSQGWEGVLKLLRARDDEPVVLSYSVCDSFPNVEHAAGFWSSWPEGTDRHWDALTEEQQEERERLQEAWYDLPSAKQWELALAGLRQRKPWARLSPETLGTVYFGHQVTVYDLLAPDRDERVAAAFADREEE